MNIFARQKVHFGPGGAEFRKFFEHWEAVTPPPPPPPDSYAYDFVIAVRLSTSIEMERNIEILVFSATCVLLSEDRHI